MNAEFEPWFRLSLAERLQLVEDLWDSIAAMPDEVPLPDWQKEELARRKAAYQQNPGSGRTWEEVQERIRNRNG